jgi:hypothetical protein
VQLAYYNMCEFCTMIPISLFITKIQNLKWGCKNFWRLLYNTGHNKCKELLPTKPQFKVGKNPTWPGFWILLHALLHSIEGFDGMSLKNVMKVPRTRKDSL